MPQYRKLYTKSVESLDIAKMPDDFTRLTWLMLPLVCCREGRGMDYPTWLRSKLYPLRQDVTDDMVKAAFDWFDNNKMIVRYEVDGRRYYYIKTWFEYQGNTSKETASIYPGPELGKNESRPTPEQLQTYSGQTQPILNNESASASASEDDSASVEDDFDKMQRLFENIVGLLTQPSDVNSIAECVKLEVTEDDIRGALKWRMDNNLKPVKSISQLVPGCIANRNMRIQKSGAKVAKKGSEYKLPEGYDYDDDDAADDDDAVEDDTKWQTFVQQHVKDRRWQNLLEYGGITDDGVTIIHVPEAAMAEAQDRFGSTISRYFMGKALLEGVPV